MSERMMKVKAWAKRQIVLVVCVAGVVGLGQWGVITPQVVEAILCGIGAGVAARG